MARQPETSPQPAVPAAVRDDLTHLQAPSSEETPNQPHPQQEEAASRPTPLDALAQELPETHDISVEQARACLERLAEVFAPHLRDRPEELAEVLRGYPLRLLLDALRILPTHEAVRLIQHADLHDLARRVRLTEYLLDDATPLYTLRELADHLEAFIAFLHQHQAFLIRTGLPPEPFRACRWLYQKLGRLYDTRRTSSPWPCTEFRRRPKRADEPPYTWIRTPGVVYQGREIRTCDYHHADFLTGLNAKDALCIEADRERLFNLKARVLQRVTLSLRRQKAEDLWADCLSMLTTTLTAEDVAFLLRLDWFYLGRNPSCGPGSDDNPVMIPGGLTDWLEVIGHVEQEVSVGELAAARRVLTNGALAGLHARLGDGFALDELYLAVVGRAEQRELDAALDVVLSHCAVVEAHWQEYRDRIDTFAHGFHMAVPWGGLTPHLRRAVPLVQKYISDLGDRAKRGEPLTGPYDPSAKPIWDPGRRELYFNGILVRRLRRYARSHLDAVLAAFSEEGWPSRIDDPVPAIDDRVESEKRYDIVKSLNNGLTGIQFFTDGDGYGWRVRSAE